MGKIEKLLYKFIKNDGIAFVLSLLVVTLLYVHFKSMSNIVDYPVFSSVIITMVFNRIVDLLKKPVLEILEDKVKLTTDYENLNIKYRATKNLITYDNAGTTDEEMIVKLFGKKEFTFPVSCDCMMREMSLEMKDSPNVMYKAPEYVSQNFDKLIDAHKMSTIYNNLNIRVDDWFISGDKFVIVTSRTTYFDSMSTNRVMDYTLENGISIRNMYEYGPVISPLKESKLSNHLGFNAFVETVDGEFAFIERSKTVSIGKKTYGNSVSASLKTKYALDENGVFNVEGLNCGILNEIKDELSIENQFIKSYRVISAYRDLLEGGKPQLLVYVKTKLDKTAIMQEFNRDKRRKSKKMESDGEKILWIKKNDLINMSVVPGGMVYLGKFLPMLPSVSASVVMLMKYLEDER